LMCQNSIFVSENNKIRSVFKNDFLILKIRKMRILGLWWWKYIETIQICKQI